MRRIISRALFALTCALAGCDDLTPNENLFAGAVLCDIGRSKEALAKGGDPNARDETDQTPLMVASYGGCTDVVRMLVVKGADVNARIASGSFSGETALIIGSSSRGRPETVTALIQAGGDVNAKSKSGYTALAAAARYGQFEAARALIGAGADVNSHESSGITPLAETLIASESMSDNPNFGTSSGHAGIAALLRRHGGLDQGRLR